VRPEDHLATTDVAAVEDLVAECDEPGFEARAIEVGDVLVGVAAIRTAEYSARPG
jgi:hypothetical protein